MTIRIAIWDLCETLADTRHRLPFILERDPPQWEAFHALTMLDQPIRPATLVFNALRSLGIRNYICTGRSECNRKLTQAWLDTHMLYAEDLLMRRDGDTTPSPELKKVMIGIIRARGLEPVVAFEDHPPTVQMYRDNGIHCWGADDTRWRNGEYRELKHKETINATVLDDDGSRDRVRTPDNDSYLALHRQARGTKPSSLAD